MAALVNLVGRGTDRSATVFFALSLRFGSALRRSARGRYVERCEKIERTGLAGMI